MQKKKALHDEIARVAHGLYEKRSRGHDSHDLEDWLAAEIIVTEKHEDMQGKQRSRLMVSQNQGRGSGVMRNKKVLLERLGDGSTISKQGKTNHVFVVDRPRTHGRVKFRKPE